jgi:amino acid transporter
MNNKDNLKELWLKQTTEPPQMEDIFVKLTKMKRKKITVLIAVNILMAITIGFIIFIWMYFEPKFITTKIGIIITVLGIILYLFAYNQILPNLMKIRDDKNTNDFLESLLKIKKLQKYLQTKMLGIYFMTLSVGICLYLFEYVTMMTLTWSFIVYSLTLVWIGFNWFYLRPKIIQKENNKLDNVIENLEKINSQYRQEN